MRVVSLERGCTSFRVTKGNNTSTDLGGGAPTSFELDIAEVWVVRKESQIARAESVDIVVNELAGVGQDQRDECFTGGRILGGRTWQQEFVA